MSYDEQNASKANFNNVYTAPTPHSYISMMARHGYEIGEQARPYCTAAAELLREKNGNIWPVQMLDVGCSYAIGSAFVKFGCSFDEMVAFYASRAPQEYEKCCEVTRMWLNITPPVCDMRTVGLDSSGPAIQFATEAGMLDYGIARNYEDPKIQPTEQDVSWFQSCNLLMSTGAIGYVTQETMNKVLPDLGKDHPTNFGPLIGTTILRMFDPTDVAEAFRQHGFRYEAVPGILLPQRRFADEKEELEVLSYVRDRGLNVEGIEDQGKHFAELFIGAREEQFDALKNRMIEVHEKLAEEEACYIVR